eukprot:gene5917-7366_t
MGFLGVGSILERSKFGSLFFFIFIGFLGVSTSLLNYFISYALSCPPFSYEQPYYTCTIGFSAIIFALVEIQCRDDALSQSRILVFVPVPSKVYPFALLIFTQMIMPNASIIGHLSGIIIGYLYSIGIFDLILPSSSMINSIEWDNHFWIVNFVTMRGYVENLQSNSTSSFSNSINRGRSFLSSFSLPSRTIYSNSASQNNQGVQLGATTASISPSNTTRTLDYSPHINMAGRVRTKTIKRASKTLIEKYYPRLTNDFDTNKRTCDKVAQIPSKRLRNKIAGFVTHLMRRIEKGPVRGISYKLQEEEREKRDNYVPQTSAIKTDEIRIEEDVFEMLKATLDFPSSIPQIKLENKQGKSKGKKPRN